MSPDQKQSIEYFLNKSQRVNLYDYTMGLYIIQSNDGAKFESEFTRFNESNGIQFALKVVVPSSFPIFALYNA